MARKIQEEDRAKEALIGIGKGVEPCVSFDVCGNKEKQKFEVVVRERKGLFLSFYCQHKRFGFMQVRLQTWFPFQIQIYINGREWLCKRLDSKGIDYQTGCPRMRHSDFLHLDRKNRAIRLRW